MKPNPTNLIFAAEKGDLFTVRQLLAAGVDVNAQDPRGRTPLMASTHANQAEVAEVLIEAGADIDKKDEMQDTPFLYAGAEGCLEVLRVLIAHGASTKKTNRYGGSALIPAAHHGHVEVVRELLDNTNINVNHVNRLGWTALIEAVILSDGGPKHQQIVRLLLEAGADPELPDRDGMSPLQLAKSKGYREIATILIEHGATP